ncbi:MAG: dTDP-4-dehydrorhamnose reductase [Acetobacteraceae bacterium]|nr:dTDP-4-dehydrorhamnose reductase [Acetobacteraceae bacterium]
MHASPRIAILGGGGQLGRALARAGGHAVIPLRHADADVTDPASLRSAIVSARADVIVNAAAWTAVDLAESEPQRCFAVNRDGAGNVAAVCSALRIPLIHLSTDYVFDGRKGAPYAEDDARNPLNAYGAAKAAGEDLVLARHERAVVLRTAWLFGLEGQNFLRSVLRHALAGRQLRVVSDQLGCPTPAPGLARIVLAIAERMADRASAFGVVHAAGGPAATWHDMALAAINAVFPPPMRPPVSAIPTHAYPMPARRPEDSRLDCTRLGRTFGLDRPDWVRALPRLAAAIAADEAERLREVAASVNDVPPPAPARRAAAPEPPRAGSGA